MSRPGQLAVVAVAVTLVAATLAVLLRWSGPPAHVDRASLDHVAGAYHVHSLRSDGTATVQGIAEAAARTGLQFVIFTDHGDATRPPEPPTYRAGVLCLDGVEISTHDGHYVALDMPTSPYPLGGDARDVVADVRRLGGFGVIAHPDSPKEELRWHDPTPRPDAIEWINADSEWRDESYPAMLGSLLAYIVRPAHSVARLLDRPEATLARWDAQTERHRIVALPGADAHARLAWGGATDPYERDAIVALPSYDASFAAFSLRVQLDAPLSGSAEADARSVYRAIRTGRVFTSIDALARPGAVDLDASRGGASARMGERLDGAGPVRIRARVEGPPSVELALIGGGEVVHRSAGPAVDVTLERPPPALRLEARLPAAPGTPPVPWILSNPVYLAAQGAPRAARLSPVVTSSWPTAVAAVPPAAWTVEHDPTSAATLVAGTEGPGRGLRFTLGPDEGPVHAAAHVPLPEGKGAPARITLDAWSDRPRRLSIQLRGEGDEAPRWRASIYVDARRRRHTVARETLRPVSNDLGETSRLDAPGTSIDSATGLLVVVDTVNARPGDAGIVWLDRIEPDYDDARPVAGDTASDAQVRTPSNR